MIRKLPGSVLTFVVAPVLETLGQRLLAYAEKVSEPSDTASNQKVK